MNHPWRHNKRSFNGKTELKSPPQLLEGSTVFDILQEVDNSFGKKQKRSKNGISNWKKWSIFFDLPYWKSNMFRHNLDVMHIEKNIGYSIIGTLLDILGKTKDHAAARFDLKDMEKKISGYKAHDAHFMLHYLLQVPIKSILPDHVAIALVRLCSFFHRICQKVISLDEVVNLEAEIAETLCQLERIFAPSLFDIMVHLPIHLANKVTLGGPVQYRWMYPVEQYMCTLKSYVRNRSRPEGSITEGYLANECINFCTRYLHEDVQTRFNRIPRNNDECVSDEDVPRWAKGLVRGPNQVAKRFSGYIINGYRFHTRHRDVRRKTQNSGVTLEALTPSFASVKYKNPIEAKVAYYGRIVDMFELDYYGQFKVVLFKCEWYTVAKDNFGLSYVYFNKKCYQEEPFMLASQVNQCFYVKDPYVRDKHYVMKTIPRDLFRVSDDLESDSPIIYAREPCAPPFTLRPSPFTFAFVTLRH
ncbi:uncharacterized protein LOC107470705 [Arachis duranensis]|uniref:Uncharacterized protein LOC107470705 n=1 Tax=Arachis duranensis TaxID=130453 RepID=A0A6P4BPB3_ARADU|nr:uncharacterized protein LOC107470705 [Arachis duranensis]